MSPRTSLPCDMQRPNAWLDIVACSGAQNIRPSLQRLDSKRHRFSVGAGLSFTECLGRPPQDFDVVLLSLSTETNRPNTLHAPAMALDAKDVK